MKPEQANLLNSLTFLEGDNQISSNFAVLDSSGNSGMFEVYIDSNSIDIQRINLSEDTPYIVRSNHFEIIYGFDIPSSSQIRYDKADQIMKNINANGFKFSDLFDLSQDNLSINETPFLRNFFRTNLNDYKIPYPNQNTKNRPFGYFETDKSIARSNIA